MDEDLDKDLLVLGIIVVGTALSFPAFLFLMRTKLAIVVLLVLIVAAIVLFAVFVYGLVKDMKEQISEGPI